MTDIERLAAICSQPYRTDVGALLAPCCGRPIERTLPGALARKYGATVEVPCQCGGPK